MELRHIYNIATNLNQTLGTDEMAGSDVKDIEIRIKVSPTTLFGIDREFYRQTHNDSLEGFTHTHKIDALIDNIHFILEEKEVDSE